MGSRSKVRSVPPSRRLDPSLLVAFVDYGVASHERPAIVSDPSAGLFADSGRPLPVEWNRQLCAVKPGDSGLAGSTAKPAQGPIDVEDIEDIVQMPRKEPPPPPVLPAAPATWGHARVETAATGKFFCKWRCSPPQPNAKAYRILVRGGSECSTCFNARRSIEAYCKKEGTEAALKTMAKADPERMAAKIRACRVDVDDHTG